MGNYFLCVTSALAAKLPPFPRGFSRTVLRARLVYLGQGITLGWRLRARRREGCPLASPWKSLKVALAAPWHRVFLQVIILSGIKSKDNVPFHLCISMVPSTWISWGLPSPKAEPQMRTSLQVVKLRSRQEGARTERQAI